MNWNHLLFLLIITSEGATCFLPIFKEAMDLRGKNNINHFKKALGHFLFFSF